VSNSSPPGTIKYHRMYQESKSTNQWNMQGHERKSKKDYVDQGSKGKEERDNRIIHQL